MRIARVERVLAAGRRACKEPTEQLRWIDESNLISKVWPLKLSDLPGYKNRDGDIMVTQRLD